MTIALPPVPSEPLQPRAGRALRIVIALILATAVASIYLTPARHWFTLANARSLVTYLRALWYGPLILIGAYAIGCVFAVPASVFVILSGILWGWFLGGIYALIGASLGSSMAYFVGRFLGVGLLKRLGRRGEAVEHQLEHGGFRTILVLRLIPLFPFFLLNYGAGIAGMGFADYFFGTLLGTAPSHFIFAWSADAIANGTLTGRQAFVRILTVGLLLASLVIIPAVLKRRMRARIETE